MSVSPVSPDPYSAPETSRVNPSALKLIKGAVAVLSAIFVLLFLWSANARLHYPFDINDTGMLLSVKRIAAGLPLYAPPTVHFVPFLYTPLYYYLAAAMTKLTGVNYAALRSVSVLATLGCFAVIYVTVFRETRRHFFALISVALFASCYPGVQQWFDVGRVDMLCMFFVLAALYATRWWNPAVAAVLWVCAFQSKQGVLPIALLALCHDWERPKRAALGVVTFLVVLLCSIAVLTYATHGWYSFYVFGLIQSLGYNRQVLERYVSGDLVGPYGIALLLIGAACVVRPPAWRSRATALYGGAFVSMVGYTWFVRAHAGAAENALLPPYVWIAIVLGLALERITSWLHKHPSTAAPAAEFVLYSAVFFQLFAHLYSPHEFRPLPRNVEQHEAMLAVFRSLPGNIIVVDHPEDAFLAGKDDYAHGEAVGTVIDAPRHKPGELIIKDFADLVHERKVAGFAMSWTAENLLSTNHPNWMPKDFLSYYPLDLPLTVVPQPGYGIQPSHLYLPCSLEAKARQLYAKVDTSACMNKSSPSAAAP